ncbi:MAG: Rne/Rng family ribonuclease [Vulcanimicrobiaceae bacterium]
MISSDPWENRVAIMEDGALSELYIEREERVIGSILKGKVQNVLPGMGAAFVDIGMGRNAFLYVDDINKTPLNIGDVEITQGHSGFTITEKVRKGDDVLVQIVKEPRGLKGARISTNISLPGRYLILMPTGKYSGVSRKIESAAERDRLKNVMKRIRPEGMATVVRTAAANVSEAELIADLGVLIRMWHGMLETYKRAASPSLLHKDMNLVFKAARDFVTSDVEKVYIDDEGEYRKVREFLSLLGPQFLDRVEFYNNGRSLFSDYHVDEEIERLMKPTIKLPSGGSIVIESTEALTVIDVNSGKFTGGKNLDDTILKTNVEAAREVARQVRLRDIGGIIVVDFIDMDTESARSKVLKALEDGLRRDRTRATIQSFSALGLLEFTRKRIGKDLTQQLRGACPTCSGLGTVLSPQSVAIDALRRLRMQAPKDDEELVVAASPNVAPQLEFWYEDECEHLAQELGTKIHVRVDPLLHPERTRIGHVSVKQIGRASVRVGDEIEVLLLHGRMPNGTSAAAVVGDRIVEVENAANLAGNAAKIRILDIDESDDVVLAELIGSVVTVSKRKRSRKKRGEPMSATEEAAQLRELAAEAAEFAKARPPIGITTITEEEEAVDKALAAEVKGEKLEDAILIGDAAEGANPVDPARRRRRRRGRRGRGGAEHRPLSSPGQTSAAEAAEPDDHELPPPVMPGLGGRPARVTPGSSVPFEPVAAAGEPAAEGQEGAGPRRRRRRRRRGRGHAEGFTPQTPISGTVPDRHIFRVGSDGAAEPTGITAPREPSRALAPVRGAKPPAVDAPPPSLRAPKEPAKVATPTRRRRSTKVAGEIDSVKLPALPAAPPTAVKATRVARVKKTVAAAAEVEAKPKRVTRAKKADAAPAKAAPVKRVASAKKTATTKTTTTRKKATTAASTRKKKT